MRHNIPHRSHYILTDHFVIPHLGIYIHIDIHIYIHIYTHTHTHTHTHHQCVGCVANQVKR